MEASLGTLLVGTLRKVSRRSGLSIVEGLVVAAERSVTVALPCALAGIVVAIISFTGLGTKFTSFIVAAAGGQGPILDLGAGTGLLAEALAARPDWNVLSVDDRGLR